MVGHELLWLKDPGRAYCRCGWISKAKSTGRHDALERLRQEFIDHLEDLR